MLKLSDSVAILVKFHGSNRALIREILEEFLLVHQVRNLEEPSNIALVSSQSAMDVHQKVL